MRQPKGVSVSLIIPAYNEEKRLVPFLETVLSYTREHPRDITEILVVDDGSTDRTSSLAHGFEEKIPGLKVITQPRNQGKGAAIQTGVMAARGDLIIFMDADGATPISELPKMIAALQTADIAVGNRWLPGADTERHSPLRQLSGWVYRTYMRAFGIGHIDTMCGFKGYHHEVGQDLFSGLEEKRWLFDTEIAYKAVRRGYTTANIPIHWTSQDGSKLSTFTLVKSALQIWPLISRLRRAESNKKPPAGG
jgi:glycosyltransferase involved in cell wall biosynthesis